MDLACGTAIRIAEAAYDLTIDDQAWLPNVLDIARPILGFGWGCGGSTWAGISEEGIPLIQQMAVAYGPTDLPQRWVRAARDIGPEALIENTQSIAGCAPRLVSESRKHGRRLIHDTKHVACRDSLELFALDPDFYGVTIHVLTSELIKLKAKEREFWTMLMVHLLAGYRLRRKLARSIEVPGAPLTDLPHNAEAILDPNRFRVSEAAGRAESRNARDVLRDAARRVDRARGRLRETEARQAFQMWHGLVRGRWSLVDWFDTDGRRFVIARPNAPHLGDPRGLSEREQQVATYAAYGESNKMIAYRFGISSGRVSKHRSSAMRKLGVKTQAQLIERMRGLPASISSAPRS